MLTQTRRARRFLTALSAAGASALTIFAGVAVAHLVYASGDLVRGPICVGNGSGIAEYGADGGQVIAEIWTQAYGNGFCLTAKNLPAWTMYIRRQMFHWNGSEWRLCADSGDTYNASPTSYRSISRQWAKMPCGAGWYGSMANSWAYYNGQWFGGARWSGNHYF